DAAPFLRQKLRPVRFDARGIARLVADLDDDDYKVREKARAELERLDTLAGPALLAALAKGPPLEARGRIEPLLAHLEARTPGPEWVRLWRALEVLEQVGTAEARAALAVVAEGAPDAPLTVEAKAALARLAQR